MTPETTPHVREKIYAYIAQGDCLLVFRHVDFPEAGIQVPGGTVQPGEPLHEAVLREAFEETGVSGLEIVSALGDTWVDLDTASKPRVVHHRHFFHLRTTKLLPTTWRHDERDPAGGGPPIRFEYFWVPMAGAEAVLIAEMGALLHLIAPNVRPPEASGKLPLPGGQQ